jgi:hypothetical protein
MMKRALHRGKSLTRKTPVKPVNRKRRQSEFQRCYEGRDDECHDACEPVTNRNPEVPDAE